MKTLYAKFTGQRSPENQIITTIEQDRAGRLYVRKSPATPEAHSHVRQICRNTLDFAGCQQVLSVPSARMAADDCIIDYVAGTTMDRQMGQHLKANDFAGFTNVLRQYLDILDRMPAQEASPGMIPAFQAVFGQSDRLWHCLAAGHLDLIPENIVRADDGTLWSIDHEWFIDAPVPLNYIIYRACAVLYHQYDRLISRHVSFEGLLSLAGVAEDQSICRAWEELFSRKVHAGSPSRLYDPYRFQAHDLLQIRQVLPPMLTSSLFLDLDGRYTEQNSIKSDIRRQRQLHASYQLDPPVRIDHLRWDPCEGIPLVIHDCSLRLTGPEGAEQTTGQFTTNGLTAGNSQYCLHGDPQVHISLPLSCLASRIEIRAEVDYLPVTTEQLQLLDPLVRDWQQIRILEETVARQEASITRSSQIYEQLVTDNQEARSELIQLQRKCRQLEMNNEHLSQSIGQMRQSMSWRLTAPMRCITGLIRRLVNPLVSHRPLPLQPAHAILETTAGLYACTGPDPQFHIPAALVKGLHLFRYTGQASSRIQLRLYCDYGQGFREQDSQPLGYLNPGHETHERFIMFKSPVAMMRIDPGEEAGVNISLTSFAVIRLGPLQAVRTGLALLSARTGYSRLRLVRHMARLTLTGHRSEARAHFAGVFKNHGEGQISDDDEQAYAAYQQACEPDFAELADQRARAGMMALRPLISVVVPVYNTQEHMLVEMIESVMAQTYDHWELCLADGHSDRLHVRSVIERYMKKDARIKAVFLQDNLGIAGNSNAALDLAEGDYIALLDHDDLLPPWALFAVAEAIGKHDRPDLLYSDEDKITATGKVRFFPHFKPDWNPDLLRSYNYITHLFVARRELVCQAGRFRPGYDGSQDHDLILRTTELAGKIIHIPQILYHWRSHSESTAERQGNKRYTLDAGIRAIASQLDRLGLAGTVTGNQTYGFYQISYALQDTPLVSIIIPNYEHLEDLRRCLDSIRERSTYQTYEIIVVENNSTSPGLFDYYREIQRDPRIRVIRWQGAFNFSAINNDAVVQTRGQYLLFLNNDTEVIAPDWIEQMLQLAQRPDVGAVGARLLYADGTIQHAGVILGFQGIAGHAFSRMPAESPGYMARSMVVQDVSAVTAACMMIRRSVFDEAGGFDIGYQVAFNDIDLCMKITRLGYWIVYAPQATLYHHESLSRGAEDTAEKKARFESEIARFRSVWHEQLAAGDPHYNPHLDLTLRPYRISGK